MKKISLILAFILISTVVSAGTDPGFPGDDPDAPIDGGVGLLLITGAVYGLQKIRKTSG